MRRQAAAGLRPLHQRLLAAPLRALLGTPRHLRPLPLPAALRQPGPAQLGRLRPRQVARHQPLPERGRRRLRLRTLRRRRPQVRRRRLRHPRSNGRPRGLRRPLRLRLRRPHRHPRRGRHQNRRHHPHRQRPLDDRHAPAAAMIFLPSFLPSFLREESSPTDDAMLLLLLCQHPLAVGSWSAWSFVRFRPLHSSCPQVVLTRSE
mmetsp:Transcript_19672/g.60851  ORF Transcript_19672/g.60851 Transcript_19672/m.60851 type:complete len:204 (-) Transcript_19672:112-723(-)